MRKLIYFFFRFFLDEFIFKIFKIEREKRVGVVVVGFFVCLFDFNIIETIFERYFN